MSDIFREVSPGEPFSETAQFRNAVVQVLRAHERTRRNFGEDRQLPSQPVVRPRPIIIKNNSSDVVRRYGVVGLGEPINPPEENLDEFLSRRAINSIAPASSEPFAVLVDAAPTGELAEAVVLGMVQCKVNMTSAGHAFAVPIAGNYDRLQSTGSRSRASIQWADTIPAAAREEDVTLLSGVIAPTSGDGDDGDYWQDTVAEMWYGPKASGAWGSGTAFGVGVVWTVIIIADDGGLTSINGDTTAAQVLAVGTAGTDFAIAESGATHTFNLPDASATARGVINTGTQTIKGAKTFKNPFTGIETLISTYGVTVSNPASSIDSTIYSSAFINWSNGAGTGTGADYIIFASHVTPGSPDHYLLFNFHVLGAYGFAMQKNAGTINYGKTGTDPIGNVISGGIITTIGSSTFVTSITGDAGTATGLTVTVGGTAAVPTITLGGGLDVAHGGTGLTSATAGALIAGAGTSALDPLADTRADGEKVEFKIASDRWIGFSKGSY